MSTLGRKDVRINLKINPILREEFQAAAHLRGASMSSLLHQHIVKIVREEKERGIEEFQKALEFVRRVESEDEGNKVYNEQQRHPAVTDTPADFPLPETTPEDLGEEEEDKSEWLNSRAANGKNGTDS